MGTLLDEWHQLLETRERLDSQRNTWVRKIWHRVSPGVEIERYNAELRFVERLTFSSFEEIRALLDDVRANHFLGLWPNERNLAYRLACLLQPNNAEIRREAAMDLRLFGPDWDDEAERLEQEAEEIEKKVITSA
jgi:hypothetical protein